MYVSGAPFPGASSLWVPVAMPAKHGTRALPSLANKAGREAGPRPGSPPDLNFQPAWDLLPKASLPGHSEPPRGS